MIYVRTQISWIQRGMNHAALNIYIDVLTTKGLHIQLLKIVVTFSLI